jgi:A/G-specific adenine glycosylase
MNHDHAEIRDIAGFQDHLIRWYTSNKRSLPWRSTSEPYKIWVSEIMLQQTQVNTVIPYYERFLKTFPDMHSLAGASTGEVLKAWEGLGYYARARNLHRAATIIVSEHDARLPDSFDALRRLPGIGDYIAAAVLSIAFGKPVAVVDGNVKRVIARMHALDMPVNQPASHNSIRSICAKLLDEARPGTFNQSLMELGALVCTPKNPACPRCPVQRFCTAFQTNRVAVYPRMQKRPRVPEVRIAIGVVVKNGKVLITQRKADGLLGGLWEFPGGKILDGETPEAACIRELKEEVNLNVVIHAFVARIRHAYTHFKIIADVFACRCLSGKVRLKGPVDFKWIDLAEINRYPFPKANHKFIPGLIKMLQGQNHSWH